MANEATTTTYNDVFYAAEIADRILEEERPYNALTPSHFRYQGPAKSNIADFPIQQDPGVAAASTEGTGLSNAASFGSDKASATAGTIGQMTTVTDELRDQSLFDMGPWVAKVLGRSCAEKFQTDATSLLDEFANTTNTAGVALTLAKLQASVNRLEQRDQVGRAVGCLDPVQIGDCRQDAATSGAAILGSPNAQYMDLVEASLDSFAFEYAGVPWLQSSLVSATGGGVFIVDVALGMYEVWKLRIETQRDASMPGTEVVAFQRYGVIEVRDRAGETILI